MNRNSRHSSGKRTYFLAIGALMISLLLIYLYWQNASLRREELTKAEFGNSTIKLVTDIQQRLNSYELLLRGGATFFAANAEKIPSQDKWNHFITAQKLNNYFPEIEHVIYISSLTPTELAQQLGVESNANRQELQGLTKELQDIYAPVIYVYPNQDASALRMGNDILRDSRYVDALKITQTTHRPMVSTPIRNDKTGITSIHMFYPVERDELNPSSKSSRKSAFLGWIAISINLDKFFSTMISSDNNNLAVEVWDNSEKSALLLYQNNKESNNKKAAFGLYQTNNLTLPGSNWNIKMRALSSIGKDDESQLTMTIVLGLLAAVLLVAVIFSQARTSALAYALADRMSRSYENSEIRFRSSMFYSAIGNALLNSQGEIIEANPALQQILNKTSGELQGSAVLSHPFISSLPADVDQKLRENARIVHRETISIERDDMEVRHLKLTYSAVPEDKEKHIRALVQVEDITEQIRAEERIQALNRTLEARVHLRTRELMHLNQDLKAFSYSVSHDLRTPLRTVEGFGRLLKERYGDALGEHGRGYLQRINNAAQRMDQLISSLLKLTRVNSDLLKPTIVNLSEIANEVLSDLKDNHIGRNVSWAIQANLHAFGDEVLLRNLLQNLFNNAWKFTSSKTAALIEFGRYTHDNDDFPTMPQHFSAFYIKDNGVGFEQQYVNKLFQPFQRLHTEEAFVGSGIGLASVKRIVERHGGTVFAKGEEDNGACIVFTLPINAKVMETGLFSHYQKDPA